MKFVIWIVSLVTGKYLSNHLVYFLAIHECFMVHKSVFSQHCYVRFFFSFLVFSFFFFFFSSFTNFQEKTCHVLENELLVDFSSTSPMRYVLLDWLWNLIMFFTRLQLRRYLWESMVQLRFKVLPLQFQT